MSRAFISMFPSNLNGRGAGEKSPATAGIANGDDESGDVVQIAITGAAVLSLVVLDVALALSGSAILGYRFSRSRSKHQR